MSEPLTPRFLLEGAVYALEQCGLLLSDASVLYANKSYATSVALAGFAREELGKWKILLELRKKVVSGQASKESCQWTMCHPDRDASSLH
jgi:AbiV family abortive infection protein